MTHLQRVPVTRQVVTSQPLVENRPRKNVCPVKTSQSHLPCAWIKTVVLIASVGRPSQASGSGFIFKFHLNRQLKWCLGNFPRREAQRAPTKTFPGMTDMNSATLTPPMPTKNRCPFFRAKLADGHPPFDRDRIWFFEYRLE